VSVPRRRWPGRPGPANEGNFVSGIRFRRSFQEANPQSIWLKAAFGPGLSYQLVLSNFTKTPIDQDRALRPRSRQTLCISHAKRPRHPHVPRGLPLPQPPPIGNALFSQLSLGQIRLKPLMDHGLLQRWQVIEPPGITRRPSVLLLSPRGARVLAASRSGDPTSLQLLDGSRSRFGTFDYPSASIVPSLLPAPKSANASNPDQSGWGNCL
jgi:hypothetical protein